MRASPVSLELVILAAGKGKRMRSGVPKPLIHACGRPLAAWALAAAGKLKPERTHLVVNEGDRDAISRALAPAGARYPIQREPMGTAHAVEAALPGAGKSGTLMVLCADMPLVEAGTLRRLLKGAKDGLALLVADLDPPTGYGRILRGADGRVTGIVEERDASAAERAVRTAYAGAMAAPSGLFRDLIPLVAPSGRTGERYLTELARLCSERGMPVSLVPASPEECLGANTPAELAAAERILERRLVAGLLERGTRLRDPDSLRLRGDLRCGQDVEIDANVIVEGDVRLASGARVGPNCVLRNVSAGKGTAIRAFCHIEDCRIGDRCVVGPFARIRGGASLGDEARVGNFVEVKKSEIGRGAKASHLSYLGDATVGAGSNVGAGVITCNYDGKDKHRTLIGDGAFVGSGVELVAPIRVGAGALVAAGSTLTKDVPAGETAFARARQVSVSRKRAKGRS